MRTPHLIAVPVVAMLLTSCEARNLPTVDSPLPGGAAAGTDPWGPESPPFNLEAVLTSTTGDGGFGLVKFRQPNDADQTVYLDTWVRDLAPRASYRLQRAVDAVVDGTCTNASGWLTLGLGLTPQAIETDDRGTGRAQLFRSLAAFAPGSRFDINFRIIEDATGTVVLQSGCYEFVITK